jgi:hypothetical protein
VGSDLSFKGPDMTIKATTVAGLAAILLVAGGCRSGGDRSHQPEKAATSQSEATPSRLSASEGKELVRQLVENPAEGDWAGKSVFARSLARLGADWRLNWQAKEQATGPDTIYFGNGMARWPDGRAVKCAAGGKEYVVVVLGSPGLGVPGSSAQEVLLLDGTGHLLDHIACDINCRYGELATVIPALPAEDGARIVFEFIPRMPDQKWHNWHSIVYGNRAYGFQEREGIASEWQTKGLCRMTIKEDRLVVLFPKLWPNPSGSELKLAFASTTPEDLPRALAELKQFGPTNPPNTYVGGDYVWYEIADKPADPAVCEKYQDRWYILLYNPQSYLQTLTMICRSTAPECKVWGLKSARAVKVNGGCAVECIFDDAGKRLFDQMVKTQAGGTLAVLVDNKVIATLVLRSSGDTGKIVIGGKFSASESAKLADALQAGMVERAGD